MKYLNALRINAPYLAALRTNARLRRHTQRGISVSRRIVMRRHAMLSCIVLASLVTTLGCHDDPIAPVHRDPSTAFWRLSLNYHAIVLSTDAPHNTVQLTATPLNIFGDTIPHSTPVTFFTAELADTTLTLNANGLVTANSEISRAAVIARTTIDGITLADTAYIMIRRQTPIIPLSSFSIQPEPSDSNWMWSAQVFFGYVYPNEKYIPVFATNQASEIISPEEMMVAIWPERSEIASRQDLDYHTISSSLTGDTGSVLVHAEMLYYGTLWTDTMRLYIIPPPYRETGIATLRTATGAWRRELQPATLTIYAGTSVRWGNLGPNTSVLKITDLSFLHDDPFWDFAGSYIGAYAIVSSGDSVDLVFDHPELVDAGAPQFGQEATLEGGNISAWAPVQCVFANGDSCNGWFSPALYPQLRSDVGFRTRAFPVPGTYHYHSTRHPELQGTVIVTDSLRVPHPLLQRNAAR